MGTLLLVFSFIWNSISDNTSNPVVPGPVNFTAYVRETKVVLQWQHLNVKHAHDVYVERKTDHGDFESIGKLAIDKDGKYSFIDHNANTVDDLYYRLNIVSENTSGYSRTIHIVIHDPIESAKLEDSCPYRLN